MKRFLKKCFYIYKYISKKYGFFGNYTKWEDASKKCRGYDDDLILNKVVSASQEVVSGKAVFERDSVCFYENSFVHYIMYYIMLAKRNNNCVIIDWGGSCGSIYFQHKSFLDAILKDYKWIIVEQSNYVKCGKEMFEDEHLTFVDCGDNVESKLKEFSVDIVLARASLQYIEKYREIINIISKLKPMYIILDRMPIGTSSQICIQKVPPYIYDAEYPVRIFTEKEVLSFFPHYTIFERIKSMGGDEFIEGGGRILHQCYVFKFLD